jgi:UDP-N-acetylmuramoyl-L-alanyl-D-glutamate--2,6-diaminopimelate ligase
VGEFQVYNVMAALGAVIACGGNAAQAVKACAYLKGVPGRLEKVAPGVYVDYSHKPEALAAALRALRPHTKGKLWVVFGCGGNRDTLKRPMMGEIADRLADKIIITDDNPRHEDPAAIRQQILAKCPRANEIGSRSQAIEPAVKEMDWGDVVLIAGKGHETYQLVGDQTIPFNDGEEVQKCINR